MKSIVMPKGIIDSLIYFHDFPEIPVLGDLKNECFLKGDVITPKNPLGIK